MKNISDYTLFICSVTSHAIIQGVFYHYGNTAGMSCDHCRLGQWIQNLCLGCLRATGDVTKCSEDYHNKLNY
jgi:hypothetical protein